MSDLEFIGQVAQKPADVNADRHSFFTGGTRKPKAPKPVPIVHEEVRVRDEDYQENELPS